MIKLDKHVFQVMLVLWQKKSNLWLLSYYRQKDKKLLILHCISLGQLDYIIYIYFAKWHQTDNETTKMIKQLNQSKC